MKPKRQPRRRRVTTVRMTVDYDGLTDLFRSFWMEGRYRFCEQVFGSCHLDWKQAVEVLSGRLRMAPSPDGDGGVLVPDSWTPPDGVFYPDPASVSSAEELARLRARNEELECRLDAPEDVEPRSLAEIHRDMWAGRVIDSLLNPEVEPVEKDNAWVLPDGQVHWCGPMGHIVLAQKLGVDEGRAESLGWTKLSTGLPGIHVLSQQPPTQAQINRVFQWAEGDPARLARVDDWLERWRREAPASVGD
jgi:hypothetical protein